MHDPGMRSIVGGLSLLLLVLPGAFAAPGDLDPSYGSAGVVFADVDAQPGHPSVGITVGVHPAGSAVLSVSTGLLNLFPVPLLDGGHLMFYGIEAMRGRPLSERAQEYSFRIGLALVGMLMKPAGGVGLVVSMRRVATETGEGGKVMPLIVVTVRTKKK